MNKKFFLKSQVTDRYIYIKIRTFYLRLVSIDFFNLPVGSMRDLGFLLASCNRKKMISRTTPVDKHENYLCLQVGK